MAFPPFDPSKHARGAFGRFTSSGMSVAAQRFRLGGVARVRAARMEGQGGKVVPRRGRPESRARKRRTQFTERAVARKNPALTDVERRRDLMWEVKGHTRGRTPRMETKRTVGGKAVTVRGYAKPYVNDESRLRYYGHRQRVRNRAGAKMKAPKRLQTAVALYRGHHRG